MCIRDRFESGRQRAFEHRLRGSSRDRVGVLFRLGFALDLFNFGFDCRGRSGLGVDVRARRDVVVSVGKSRDRRRWEFYTWVFYLAAGLVGAKSLTTSRQALAFVYI